jgi:hypothetical protein
VLQVTFECCGNGPVPSYWDKQIRLNNVEKVTGHGIMGNAEGPACPRSAAGARWCQSERRPVVFTGLATAREVARMPQEVTYERALPLAKALHPDTLLAYEMNGAPLPALHGFPRSGPWAVWHDLDQVARRHSCY